MTPEQFDEAIRLLRSPDPMTYEEGYHWLQGDNLKQHIQRIAELLETEVDPNMRAKFVELVGDADLPEYVPLLVRELSGECREVRSWAYNMLSNSMHATARFHAEQYRMTHPHEDFF